MCSRVHAFAFNETGWLIMSDSSSLVQYAANTDFQREK